jgi:hypothetical protein
MPPQRRISLQEEGGTGSSFQGFVQIKADQVFLRQPLGMVFQ